MTSQVGVSTCDDRSGSAGTAEPYRGDGSIAAHHPAQGEGHVGVRGGGEPLEAVEPVGPVRLGLSQRLRASGWTEGRERVRPRRTVPTAAYGTDRGVRYRPRRTLPTAAHATDRGARYRPRRTLPTAAYGNDRRVRY